MTIQRRLLPLVLTLSALAAGCGGGQEPPSVRDVRPDSVQLGDTLEIEGRGFATGAGVETLVRLVVPPASHAAANAVATTIDLPAHAVSASRLLAPIDEAVEDRLAGRHVAFTGAVEVWQQAPGAGALTKVADSGPLHWDVDFFAPSLRKLAYGLVRRFNEGRLETWLGLTLRPATGGLLVQSVRARFSADAFVAAYDTPPYDATITRQEAYLRYLCDAPSGPCPGFDPIDRNHDGMVTLHEAQDYEAASEVGLDAAADAGMRPGDLVTAVDGAAVRSLDDFAHAWQKEGPRATVTLSRTSDVPGGAAAVMTVDLPRSGAPLDLPEGFLLAGILILAALLILLPTPICGGLIVVWERKIAGRMQSRLGPNRVGPQGWLQWLADGIKLILKEDIVPDEADPVLFKLSPYLTFTGLMCTFVVLPFSQTLVIANMNVGLLFLTSVTSLVVVGIIMGGWASNSKWSLLGGMRSAAQIISYELPASLALLSVVTICGSLAPQAIVRAQGGWPWEWNLFDNPAAFACFFIYFISALAEGNRTPFDLPEAESELVSGYNTEYSGFRFAIFFLTEWVNLYVIGAIATTVFLGGWQLPGLAPAQLEHSLGLQALSFLAGATKATVLVFVIIWVRWTLPRFRVDQMMNMCWKYFIPIALGCFLFSSAWVWIAPDPHSALRLAVKITLFALLGLGTGAYFLSRVVYTFRKTHAELNANPFI